MFLVTAVSSLVLAARIIDFDLILVADLRSASVRKRGNYLNDRVLGMRASPEIRILREGGLREEQRDRLNELIYSRIFFSNHHR